MRGRSNTVFSAGFFADDGLDFAFRGALGRAPSGASEVGELLATAARIGSRRRWTPEWTARAVSLQELGRARSQDGDDPGAAAAFLRAAGYWALALGGLTDGSDADAVLAAFRAHRACWESMIDCSGGHHERVSVPYEGATLPGYLLRPDATGHRRPTLVVTNGSDGALSGVWGEGAAAALARGWNAFVYDGPGQQSMLFERGVGFRPDWEAVLTPVVDALVAREDVDAERLTASAVSQGGYWLPRALASEHRFVAAVADPGVVDVSTAWTAHLPASMTAALDEGDRRAFERGMRWATLVPALRRTLRFRARPYVRDSWFDAFTEVRRYRLTPELAEGIRTPLMITDPQHEQFWPGQSARLAAMVPGSRLVSFTAAEGADGHCEPLGRQLAHERMFAFLDEHLARV